MDHKKGRVRHLKIGDFRDVDMAKDGESQNKIQEVYGLLQMV